MLKNGFDVSYVEAVFFEEEHTKCSTERLSGI